MNNLVYPIVRYQFEANIETVLTLPFYSGSMLRGAFGHALRQISCVTKMKECKACLLKQACPYTVVFEPSMRKLPYIQNYTQLPAQYVIEPPISGQRVMEPGEKLRFSMVLVGEIIKQLPLIILAWQHALVRGLGTEKSKLSLLNVRNMDDNMALVWTEDEPFIKPHLQTLTLKPDNEYSVTLDITTPMRFQRKSKLVKPDDINPMDLMAPLLRRLNMIEQICHLPISHTDIRCLVEQARTLNSKPNLNWTDWQRYSQRQHQKIALGGVTGQWTISGDIAQYSLALKLGQWLHIGKNTTFGMGRYTLNRIN